MEQDTASTSHQIQAPPISKTIRIQVPVYLTRRHHNSPTQWYRFIARLIGLHLPSDPQATKEGLFQVDRSASKFTIQWRILQP